MSTTPPDYSSALLLRTTCTALLAYVSALHVLYSSYVSARLLYSYLYTPRHDAILPTLLREARRVQEHLLLIIGTIHQSRTDAIVPR